MKRAVLVFAFATLFAAAPRADDVPIPPAPTRWATDAVGFISPGTLQALDSRLEAFESATGHQVIVWIGETTGDVPLEDWTVRAFEQWKVGRKGLDDGLILFLFAGDRRARIEVGYGIEERVPDAIASRILNDDVLPRLRAGDPDGAVLAGIDSLLSRIGGSPVGGEEPPSSNAPGGPPGRPLSVFQMIVLGALGLGFLVLLITNPGLALYLLFSILSSGRGGGGGFGGGGFGGGGGRSGGGGASGRW